MDFLQLGQRLQLECGVSGTLSTMQNQIGSLGRLVTWTNAAWMELQTKHDDWDWMRSSNLLGAGVSFSSVYGQSVYPLGSGAGTVGVTSDDFGKWDLDTFRCYTTAAGTNDETFLDPIGYDAWRNAYMLGAMRQVRTRPVVVARAPNESICLGPPTDSIYTITGDYFVAPTQMEEDDDVPTGLPTQFHNLIVFRGMMMYGAYEAAPEVSTRGEYEWKKQLAELEARKVPQASFCGALA